MGFAQTTLSITGILTTTNYSLGIATTGSLKVAAGIASNQLQKWIAPCSYIDNVLVGIVASINAKKQEIVDIAELAHLISCKNGLHPVLILIMYWLELLQVSMQKSKRL